MHRNNTDNDQYWIVVPLVGGGKTGEYGRTQKGFNSTGLGRYTEFHLVTLYILLHVLNIPG